jgi:hypothetical protein
MTHFTLLDRMQDYRAIHSLWSSNPAERAVAATFLRLGDQLEAQWENNDIQRRLCNIALRTNDMLADMCSSLADLTASHARTNELLAQSLAVQTDHYMLEKRERVLKDAVFRWTEILTTGEGLSDPHWVLIASRTFLEFLKGWNFTTEDLQDANEKRSFLGLTKRAKENIKNTPQEIVAEVNVFQSLYGDFTTLNDPAVVASIKARQFIYNEASITLPIEVIKNLMNTLVGSDVFGQIFVSTQSAGVSCPPQENLCAFVHRASETVKSAGETPILAIYGVSSHPEPSVFGRILSAPTRQLCVLMTDAVVHSYSTSENPREPVANKESFTYAKTPYRDHTGFGFAGMKLDAELTSLICRANTLAFAIMNHLREFRRHQLDATQHCFDQDKAKAIQEIAEKARVVGECINDYLDAHPSVRQFYAQAD